ncbi:unnamed protein product [Amoebophrya sp. A120]|nr:unnamed protein product [Amoebophrya sp. A120]|eukprot:GSA120T00007900001.1
MGILSQIPPLQDHLEDAFSALTIQQQPKQSVAAARRVGLYNGNVTTSFVVENHLQRNSAATHNNPSSFYAATFHPPAAPSDTGGDGTTLQFPFSSSSSHQRQFLNFPTHGSFHTRRTFFTPEDALREGESCPTCACEGCQTALGSNVGSQAIECPNVPHHSKDPVVSKALWYSRLVFIFFAGISLGGYLAFWIRGRQVRKRAQLMDDDGEIKRVDMWVDDDDESSDEEGMSAGDFFMNLFGAPVKLANAMIEQATGVRLLPDSVTEKVRFSFRDRDILERTDLTDMEKAFLIMKGDYEEHMELSEREKAILKDRSLTDMEKAFQMTREMEEVNLPGHMSDMQKAFRELQVDMGLRPADDGGVMGALLGEDELSKKLKGKSDMEKALALQLNAMGVEEEDLTSDMQKAFNHVAAKYGLAPGTTEDDHAFDEDGNRKKTKKEGGVFGMFEEVFGKSDMEQAYEEVAAKVDKKKKKKKGLFGGLFG